MKGLNNFHNKIIFKLFKLKREKTLWFNRHCRILLLISNCLQTGEYFAQTFNIVPSHRALLYLLGEVSN